LSIAKPDRIWEMPTRHVGRHIHVFDQIDSTNNLALLLARDPAHEGVAILARQQTAGRGQFGRTWQAPPDSSVLLSLVVFPPADLRRPVLMTAWAAVSVCEVIQVLTNMQARIKWPNDVLLQGKKVCGILIEQHSGTRSDGPAGTVVGIGLNVHQSPDLFHQAQLPLAGSIFSLTGQELDSTEIARHLVMILDEYYAQLLGGETAPLEALWKWRLGLLGKRVRLEWSTGNEHGRVHEIAFNGLELEKSTGVILSLRPEEIKSIETSNPL
jgi:BirA family biotin operon repressor/biotin-[acetyl-CoA-carboxylase] ligase